MNISKKVDGMRHKDQLSKIKTAHNLLPDIRTSKVSTQRLFLNPSLADIVYI